MGLGRGSCGVDVLHDVGSEVADGLIESLLMESS